MTALPARTGAGGIVDAATTEGQQKNNLGDMRDFMAALFGTNTDPLRTVLETLRAVGPDTIYNLSLVPTVGSNALTINAKTRAGGVPSTADPALVSQRNATAGSGDFNLRAITAAQSLVVSSGSTLGHTSAQAAWIYVYELDNAGAQEFAVSSKFFGLSGIVSTTAEGGAGAADSAEVMYSTTARSNLPYRCVGRMKSSQTTAGTWAAVPTEVQLPPFDQRVARKVADIAAATVVNLNAVDGDTCDITGNTTITTVLLDEGREFTARFTGTPTLTNGANLVLPTGANIVVVAGAWATFRGYAAGVVRVVALGLAAAASQAQMEAAAANDVGVTPLSLKWSPSALKAWIAFNGTGTPAVLGSLNMDGGTPITDNSLGDYTLNIGTDFSGVTYAAGGICGRGTAGGGSGVHFVQIHNNINPTAGALRVQTIATASVFDAEYAMVLFAGDQA